MRLPLEDAAKAARLIAGQMEDSFVYNNGDIAIYGLINTEMDRANAGRAARVLIAAISQESDAEARWWLSAALALGVARMEPKEGAKICGPVFADIVNAFTRKKYSETFDGYYNGYLTDGLKTASAGADPARNRDAASSILEALKSETDPGMRQSLASALAGVETQGTIAGRLEPDQNARAARALLAAFANEQDFGIRKNLADCLVSVSGQMNEADRSQVLERAIRKEIERPDFLRMGPRMGSMWNPQPANIIDSMARHLSAAAAARVCAHAVNKLIGTLEKSDNVDYFPDLPADLEYLMRRLNPLAAEQECERAIRILLRKTGPTGEGITRLLVQLPPSKGNVLAREQTLSVCAGNAINPSQLDSVMADAGRAKPGERTDHDTLSVMLGWQPPKKPLPCRLTTQELVELLKMPTCFGRSCRVVLDHLGNIHDQRFANHWSFVRFAREKRLDVDLTTPPKRPDRQETINRMLAILDGKS